MQYLVQYSVQHLVEYSLSNIQFINTSNIGFNIGSNIWFNIQANIGFNMQFNMRFNMRFNIRFNIGLNMWFKISIGISVGKNPKSVWMSLKGNQNCTMRQNLLTVCKNFMKVNLTIKSFSQPLSLSSRLSSLFPIKPVLIALS